MTSMATAWRVFALGAAGVLLAASSVLAQTIVRVIQDDTTIWTTGVPTVAAIVSAGTELEVVARRGEWYEVVVYSPATGRRTGLVRAAQVEPVDPSSRPAADQPSPSPAPRPRPAAVRQTPRAVSTAVPRGLRGFGQLAYGRFLADESFAAVFDRPGGLWFGGGLRYGFASGWFLQASVDRLERTGERVFVFEDEVFPLGLETALVMTPVAVTAGYYMPSGRLLPYVGIGLGRYYVSEASEFAEPGDDLDRHFPSYHGLLGVEWRSAPLLAFGVEGQFTHVPGALESGVGPFFDERNLGGFELRLRVLVGR